MNRMNQVVLAALFALIGWEAPAQVPQTIVIQGKLENGAGQPLTGNRGWRVRFFDQPSAGFQIGGDLTGTTNIPVTGRFTLEVAPPSGVFAGGPVYYELAVDSAATPDGVDSGDVFAGRPKLNSVPFALMSQDALSSLDSDSLGGVPAASYALKSGVTLQGAYDGAGAGAGRTINAANGAVTITGAGGLASSANVDSAGSVRATTALTGGLVAAQLARTADGGRVEANDESGNQAARVGAATGGSGGIAVMRMANPALSGTALIGDPAGTNAGGQVAVFNGSQNFTSTLTVSSGGSGLIDVYAGTASNVPVVTAGASSANGGYFQVADAAGSPRVVATQVVAGHGVINIANSSGVTGVQLVGNGTKSFVAQDPQRADRMIRYVCLEGPEAGMYCRGKAQLKDGRASIEFPGHFRSLAAADSVTVSLTPRSSGSRGLAAENVTASGFDVVELAAGTGAYEVDWVAYAVRAGFEDFPVYIPAGEWRAQFEPQLPPVERATPAQVLSLSGGTEAGQ